MSTTTYYRQLATEAVLKGQPSPAANAFVGLGSPTFTLNSDSTISSGEVQAVGYFRQKIQWSDFVGAMSNVNMIQWEVTAGWPTILRVFVSDSSQGGRVLLWDLVPSVIPISGDTIVIEAGSLTLT